jgi:hypothetical protein
MRALLKRFGIGLFAFGTCLASCADEQSDLEPTTAIRSGLLGHPSTIGVARRGAPSVQWLLRDSNTPGWPTYDFWFGPGELTSQPVVGDWDGNGTTTTGVVAYQYGDNYRWLLRNSLDDGYPSIDLYYGNPAPPYRDIPIVGDWDGNGTTTIGVYRPGYWNGGPVPAQWLLRNTNTPGPPDMTIIQDLSTPYEFVPVVGDWDGNGTTTVGLYRRSAGPSEWLLQNLTGVAAPETGFTFGGGYDDLPIVGDWDGNGTTTVGLLEEHNGSWRWRLSDDNSTVNPNGDFDYGAADDWPVVGVWTY